MNEVLEEFARDNLKKHLAKLTEKQQHLFIQMYGFENRDKDINYVVDNMDAETLDWAMMQARNTLTSK